MYLFVPLSLPAFLSSVERRCTWDSEIGHEAMEEDGLLCWIMISFRCVCHLPGEHSAPGMGRRQPRGDKVMLWAMFCRETNHLAIHMDVPLTGTTCLITVADPVHPTNIPRWLWLLHQDNGPCHKCSRSQKGKQHNIRPVVHYAWWVYILIYLHYVKCII